MWSGPWCLGFQAFSFSLHLLPLCLLFLLSNVIHHSTLPRALLGDLWQPIFQLRALQEQCSVLLKLHSPKICHFHDYISPKLTVSASHSIKPCNTTDFTQSPGAGACWGLKPASTALVEILLMQWVQQTSPSTKASKKVRVGCAGAAIRWHSLMDDVLVSPQKGEDHNSASEVSWHWDWDQHQLHHL